MLERGPERDTKDRALESQSWFWVAVTSGPGSVRRLGAQLRARDTRGWSEPGQRSIRLDLTKQLLPRGRKESKQEETV